MTAATEEQQVLTVGQIAEQLGVTVRTLHHYDEIGLVTPSARSHAGYRLYAPADIDRLRSVVVYRRLGLPLEQIHELLAQETPGAVAEHLQRQRAVVVSRLAELTELLAAIDRAWEQEMNGVNLTPQEQRELFGDSFSDEYAAEAQERWGGTDAWRQSEQRTREYTKADWEQIKAESEAVNAAFVAALTAGLPATSAEAMDAAEAARAHIERWFYDLDAQFHRKLSDMYVTEPRYTKTYEDVHPGLAQYVRDAIHANADRQAHVS
ncbi:MerR family transcriptional regulator [Georgenia sp. TF02-10]|uniref:MerR family transcriptional regulator n=1 Tax=Georgenia sp. TF02-10 TaxID=2917725 RepID=UPI001FA8082A|nr:MerR family transcriptional regulator [Georgenia sp. TF02-10]UNX55147.1 MerR family transcriptional regulator [Georgenia sp. TF02-10]